MTVVKLHYPKDAEKIVGILEEDTGRKFAVGFYNRVGGEPVFTIQPVIGAEFRTGEPLTEEQLRNLSERAYEKYIYFKTRVLQPPVTNYYVIKIGKAIFGKHTPSRGRIASEEKAYDLFKQNVLNELWNYYYGGILKGMWNKLCLLYYEHEDAEPRVIQCYETPEQALQDYREEFEEESRRIKLEHELERKLMPEKIEIVSPPPDFLIREPELEKHAESIEFGTRAGKRVVIVTRPDMYFLEELQNRGIGYEVVG